MEKNCLQRVKVSQLQLRGIEKPRPEIGNIFLPLSTMLCVPDTRPRHCFLLMINSNTV